MDSQRMASQALVNICVHYAPKFKASRIVEFKLHRLKLFLSHAAHLVDVYSVFSKSVHFGHALECSSFFHD